MEVTGVIVRVLPTEEKNGFKSRQLIVRTSENPQYPQEISIQFIKDKCDELNNYQENQEVKVQCNLQGRKWTNPQGIDVWFNTIQGWKIDRVGQQPNQHQGYNQAPQPQNNFNQNTSGFPPAPDFGNNEEPDLPF